MPSLEENINVLYFYCCTTSRVSDYWLKASVASPPCQTDKSGRLKLETVDDLFNILQLRKRRRERKAPVHKKRQPEPEIVVKLQTLQRAFYF